MIEFKPMKAPTGARIIGVLETMKVYLEVNDGIHGTRTGDVRIEKEKVVVSKDYQKSKYHQCETLRLYLDTDGKYWFEHDLVSVENQ